jgi:hypothetical protein
MSYRIEYDWVAVRLPKQRIESAYEDHFILASLGGDNNIYSRDGKRPRSWSCMAFGMHWEVMQRAVEFSAACEGGSLKPHGRWVKPESYIARMRRVVDEAWFLDDARSRGFRLSLRIDIDVRKMRDRYDAECLEKFRASRSGIALQGNGDGIERFILSIDDDADLSAFARYHWLSESKSLWRKIEVAGPGES